MSKPLGWHWMAQIADAPRGVLADPAALRDVLAAVVDALGLRAVSAPTAVPTASGVAAVVLLAESHLAVHTLAAEGRALVDLFSCTPVDAALARRTFARLLGTDAIRDELVERLP
ncbi:MAG: hypothetical protein EP330_29430 [Deltaproteobacteria bacterium]|nr:MAG: hypothetical protein EP330_29430 [Deltaproteobacteria bacterium]